MKKFLFLLGLYFLLAAEGSQAQDKPVAYDVDFNSDSPAKDEVYLDGATCSALADKYQILHLKKSSDYREAQPLGGTLPHEAKSDTGGRLTGYVLVAFVLSNQGKVADPVVLKSTDPALIAPALEALSKWSFIPAKLNGAPISTTQVQEFYFEDETKPHGYAMDSIALYQPQQDLGGRMRVESAADYLKSIAGAATTAFENDPIPESLQIIVVVWPGNRARVWFISSRDADDGHLYGLKLAILALPVPNAIGDVAFDLNSKIAGGDGKGPDIAKSGPPLPEEWKDISGKASKEALTIDQILDLLPAPNPSGTGPLVIPSPTPGLGD